MTGTRLVLLLVTVAALAGCGGGGDSETPEHVDKVSGSGCIEVMQDAKQQADALAEVTAEMVALEDSGQLEPGAVETSSPDDWWFDGADQAGPGAARWSELRAQAVEAARLWARIIVNNQTCFSATDVAKAQEWLRQSG